MQAIKELSSFFNTVRQAIFRFKPNGFDSRKANNIVTHSPSAAITPAPSRREPYFLTKRILTALRPKLPFCHPEPKVKDLVTIQTNVICTHSKRLFRSFGVTQGLNYYIKSALAVDILSCLR